MKRNHLKALVALVAVGAIAATLPLAGASSTRNYAVNATLKSREVETRGSVAIDAGLIRDARLGEGAAIVRTTSAGGTELDIRFKVFYPAGMQKGIGTLTIAPQPDGTVTFTGTGRFTGGTKGFRGISGQLRFNGTATADGLVTVEVRGNARY
jgi:hypothetical protein